MYFTQIFDRTCSDYLYSSHLKSKLKTNIEYNIIWIYESEIYVNQK